MNEIYGAIYCRSGVELSSGIANFYCGFDLLDSAASDDAGGNNSVGTTERKIYEQQSSSSAARVPPDYQLCQAFLEDVFAFVSKSKVVPFLEKLRDSNSMTKVCSLLNIRMTLFCIFMLSFYCLENECSLCVGMD